MSISLTVHKGAARGTGTRMQEYLSILPLSWFYAYRDQHHPKAAIKGKQ